MDLRLSLIQASRSVDIQLMLQLVKANSLPMLEKFSLYLENYRLDSAPAHGQIQQALLVKLYKLQESHHAPHFF